MQLYDGTYASSFVDWMFDDQPRESRQSILQSIDDIMSETIGQAGFLGLRVETPQNASIVAYVMLYPGKLAILTGPKWIGDAKSDLDALQLIASEMCSALSRLALQKWDIEMVQATIPYESDFETKSLSRAGFRYLASLHQLVLLLPMKNRPALPDASLSHWYQADNQHRTAICRWLDSTYVDTLDCPELSQLRSTSNVLDGYWTISAGSSSQRVKPKDATLPAWWFYGELCNNVLSEIETGYLLTPIQDATWELTYFGVGVDHRGKGLGNLSLSHALNKLHELGARQLYAYVDNRNKPAIQMYDRAGFRSAGSWNAFYFAEA